MRCPTSGSATTIHWSSRYDALFLHPRHHRQHATCPALAPLRHARRRMDEARACKPGRQHQGPDRALDDRGCGVARPAHAGHDDRGAHQRQHRHRAGHGCGGEGLPPAAGDAREHVGGASPRDARVWRRVRAHGARAGHEGGDCARERIGREHRGCVDAAAVRQRREHRDSQDDDRTRDHRGLRGWHRLLHHRRGYRWPYHGRE